MSDSDEKLDHEKLDNEKVAQDPRSPFAVVAGYGLPGRTIVDLLRQLEIEYRVIEMNPTTCQRVSAGGVNIVEGDAGDLETLRRAEVGRATLVALMVPNEEVVLRAVGLARGLNPTAHIIARCSFTSSGLEALRRGASETIVAEQVVARELSELAMRILKK
jgi:voltage-gated potassium channel Kch